MRRGGIFMESYGPAFFLMLAGVGGVCVAAFTGGILPVILGAVAIITSSLWVLSIRQKKLNRFAEMS
jgi:hypothetical protein